MGYGKALLIGDLFQMRYSLFMLSRRNPHSSNSAQWIRHATQEAVMPLLLHRVLFVMAVGRCAGMDRDQARCPVP
jgi:hypothetical protein